MSSAAPKKKSFDRGGLVWPPRSNVTNDRLSGGSGGALPPQPKNWWSGGQRPPAKIFVKYRIYATVGTRYRETRLIWHVVVSSSSSYRLFFVVIVMTKNRKGVHKVANLVKDVWCDHIQCCRYHKSIYVLLHVYTFC